MHVKPRLVVLLRRRLVPLQVKGTFSILLYPDSPSDPLVHFIPGRLLASTDLKEKEIYFDPFHLKRSDTQCSYQQFESANHLNNEDIKLSSTWGYFINRTDAESEVGEFLDL